MDPKRWTHLEIDTAVGNRAGIDQTAQGDRFCDHQGCKAPGTFKAPKSRRALRDYHYFCLEHVQAYNRSWNFYDGMDEAQIEANRRADITWQRQTWPLGANAQSKDDLVRERQNASEKTQEEIFEKARRQSRSNFQKTGRINDLGDPFGLFDGQDWQTPNAHADGSAASGGDRAKRQGFGDEVVAALRLMSLPYPLDKDALRTRYKVLAKQLHPDAVYDAASKAEREEKLKRLNAAYEILKKNLVALSL